MPDEVMPGAEIAAHYALGLERDRLAGGAGALEFARTCALLERYLPRPLATIGDIGGGPGRYAVRLAERGYGVHLIDAMPLHVEQAREAFHDRFGEALGDRPEGGLLRAEVGDARALPLQDASMDAVLLLGPLYHLCERGDRVTALAEARRVCRPGGIVLAAAISRFASTLDGLRSGYLEDPVFAALAASDLRDGQHKNPTRHPAYFTTAYFHRPEELATECAAAGLNHQATLAVEGPGWLLPDLDERLADERRRTALLAGLGALEAEPTVVGVSAHLLVVARRPVGDSDFDAQPTLRGVLVHARPLRPEDYDALYRVASDPLVWEQHPARNRYEEPVFRELFAESLASGGALVVTDAQSGQVIGSSRYFGYRKDEREVEIGWTFLARSHWGGRYNGELKELMLRHAFRFVDSVVFLVGPDNRRSQRALEKIGAVREPELDAKGSVVYRMTAARFRPGEERKRGARHGEGGGGAA